MSGRTNKREQIREFFLANVGTSFPTAELRAQFGTAFRTRVSELNRDEDCPISLRNTHHQSPDGKDESWYFSEWRSPGQQQQPIHHTVPAHQPELLPGDATPSHLDLG